MDPITDIPGLAALSRDAAGGDPEIRIAIIDGPVDLGHPSLQAAPLTLGKGMAGTTPADIQSIHGTHIASVIMGQPGGAVHGIAPNVTAVAYPIYRERDGVLLPTSQADLAMAINRAVGEGAHLINISGGQLTRTGQAEPILADAVRRCAENGTLLVAAAGNDGCRCLHVPAALDSTLAVGACDLDGQPLAFSNFGDSYADNGILAPGEAVNGAAPQGGVVERSGTSFATPVVTGIAALLLSRLHQSGQRVDPSAVRSALLASVAPCPAGTEAPGGRCLAGRLDVDGAAAMLFDSPPHRDVPQPIDISASGAVHGRVRPPSFDQRGPSLSTQSPNTRESIMSNTSIDGAVQTPPLVGPDGALLSVAVTPATADPGAGLDPSAAPASQAAPHVTPAAAPETGQPQVRAAGHVPPQTAGGTIPAPTLAAASAPADFAASQASGATPALQASGGPSDQPPSGPAHDVQASDPGCGCPAVAPSQAGSVGEQVFVIGRLYYDFDSEARLDYFVQAIANWRDGLVDRGDPTWGPDRNKAGDHAAPYNPEIMVRFLLNLTPGETASPDGNTNFADANAIIWTETIDATPVYAIKPTSAFGILIYASLVNALWLQTVAPTLPNATPADITSESLVGGPQESGAFPPKGSVTRVSQAGHVTGSTRLLNGTVVPTLEPVWRGFYSWNLYDLLGDDPSKWPDGVQGFLERIYNEFRNVGISPQDRALNYSAMNAYNTKQIFAKVARENMRLDTVEVDRSTICRPDSDCWDVTYRFFDPTAVLTTARKIWQYTIDVSDVVPVPVGPLRHWEIY